MIIILKKVIYQSVLFNKTILLSFLIKYYSYTKVHCKYSEKNDLGWENDIVSYVKI